MNKIKALAIFTVVVISISLASLRVVNAAARSNNPVDLSFTLLKPFEGTCYIKVKVTVGKQPFYYLKISKNKETKSVKTNAEHNSAIRALVMTFEDGRKPLKDHQSILNNKQLPNKSSYNIKLNSDCKIEEITAS